MSELSLGCRALTTQEEITRAKYKDDLRPSAEHLETFRCDGCGGPLGYSDAIGIDHLVFHIGCEAMKSMTERDDTELMDWLAMDRSPWMVEGVEYTDIREGINAEMDAAEKKERDAAWEMLRANPKACLILLSDIEKWKAADGTVGAIRDTRDEAVLEFYRRCKNAPEKETEGEVKLEAKPGRTCDECSHYDHVGEKCTEELPLSGGRIGTFTDRTTAWFICQGEYFEGKGE